MRNRNPIVLAIAALIIALAGWLGFDLASLQGDAPGKVTTGTTPAPTPARTADARPPTAIPNGDFDSYLLALSWSPSYCANEATDRDRLQCGGRPFHFIVHGLWPQNDKGYPEECPTDNPRVSDALIDEMLDIMPSRGLIGHEWRSHGACTGASQEDYFAAVRAAWQKVFIPARFEQLDTLLTISPRDIVQEFINANPMLKPDQITITCSSQSLDEVRICMTKDLQFTSCGAQAKRSMCRQKEVRMPPVRYSR